eukprot:73348-Amphidinium_carterae.1
MASGMGRVQRLQKRLTKLRRAAPGHIGARQCFLQAIMAKNSLYFSATQGSRERCRAVQEHGQHFSLLADEDKAKWELRAHALRGEREKLLRDDIQYTSQDLQSAIASLQVAEDAQCAGAVKQCQWSETEVRAANAFYDSAPFSISQAKTLRVKAGKCPMPLPDDEFEELVSKSMLSVPVPEAASTLARACALRRNHMRDCVCGHLLENEWHYFRFVYASLQPIYLVWTPVFIAHVPVSTPTIATPQSCKQAYSHVPLWTWKYDVEADVVQDIFANFETCQFHRRLCAKLVHFGAITF